jgi:hypothetical protein
LGLNRYSQRYENFVRVRSKKPGARSQNFASRFGHGHANPFMNLLEEISGKPRQKPFWLPAPDFWLPYPAVFLRDIKGKALAWLGMPLPKKKLPFRA